MYLWSQNCILIYTLAHKFPTLKGKDNETKIKLFYFKMWFVYKISRKSGNRHAKTFTTLFLECGIIGHLISLFIFSYIFGICYNNHIFMLY